MPLLGAQTTLVLLFLGYILYTRRRRKTLPLPPGPKGWPVLGNALDIPTESMGPVYAEWAKRFNSDIISANALGTTMVIIDSYDTAIELLEKRAAKYSSRSVAVMVVQLMGFDSIFILDQYSERWRERRKLFVRYFRSPVSSDGMIGSVHVPEAYEFVNRLLLDLNDTPGEVQALTRHMVGSLAIHIAYGLPVKNRRDELVEMIDSMVRMLSEQVVPGKAIVNNVPWLKYIPEWLPGNGREWLPTPGMGFKRFAKSVRWMAVKFKMEAYERAVKGFGTEGVRPSFLSDALASLDAEGEVDEETRSKQLNAIQDAAATVFATAADTTTNQLHTLIFALATRPNIRADIQEELDLLLIEEDPSLPGKRTLRLPTFEDQDKLPLLMAAFMESLRWGPVTPIGVPRMTTEDDIYQGYCIPKGAVVIANQWSMLNDDKLYGPNPLEFNPDRFLRPKQSGDPGVEINPDVLHPDRIAFGFGRRMCPGPHIAQSAMWLAAASLFTVFDFEAPDAPKANYVNPQGRVDENFDAGFFCFPKKFKCEFKVRSDEARELLGELRMRA